MAKESAPRPAPSRWGEIRRVLAVRPDNIGDVVMLGPALRALKAALPEAQVTLMCSPAGSQAAPLLPWVDEVLVHRAMWQDTSGTPWPDPSGQLALVEEIRSRSFDAAFIFTSFSQSPYPPAYLCYLAGIERRVGQSKEFAGNVLSEWVRPPPDDVHQVDRNLHLLEHAGIPSRGRHLELRVSEEVQGEADELLRTVGADPDEPFVVLAPGASCQARRYSVDRFAAASSTIAARTGYRLVLVGSERERDLEAVLLSLGEVPIRSLVGRTSVPQLAGVIRRGRLLLASHSGPMHLADAFARPMVVLFSGTDLESQWRPRRAASRLLRRPTWCAPCHLFRCPYQLECLDVPSEKVAATALGLLERSRFEPPS